ncbi:MAG TPA: hypothetical protein VKO43_05415 [Candidatus Krumholzibacteriaceae bacterium]|nr:hypothetical protein [Candidatus Krumholzibacteriaceae bacterium]
MTPGRALNSDIELLGKIIDEGPVRYLFSDFCNEILKFSDQIAKKTTPFEITFHSGGCLLLKVSPYKDLFIVSIGDNSSIEIRVYGKDGFFRGLDLSLKHYLDYLSKRYG